MTRPVAGPTVFLILTITALRLDLILLNKVLELLLIKPFETLQKILGGQSKIIDLRE